VTELIFKPVIDSPLLRHLEDAQVLLPGQTVPGVVIKEIHGRSLALVTRRQNMKLQWGELIGPALVTNTVVARGARNWHWYGPGSWLVCASELETGELAVELETPLGGVASVVELSHARSILSLSGPQVLSALAKLCSLDLHPKIFVVGSCANTTMHHMAVHIARVPGRDDFELHVMRGFAVSLCEALVSASTEYGYRFEC
jgi:heterotetrameric sarcosine oxidase gamma subunit